MRIITKARVLRLLASLALTAAFGTAALATDEGRGGEGGEVLPRVYAAGFDRDPSLPPLAAVPPDTFVVK